MDGIINRDRAAIASHAQKHFIGLWYANKPLPAKVRETGEGHTLSGKPLDPESGAALMYRPKGAGRRRRANRDLNKEPLPRNRIVSTVTPNGMSLVFKDFTFPTL